MLAVERKVVMANINISRSGIHFSSVTMSIEDEEKSKVRRNKYGTPDRATWDDIKNTAKSNALKICNKYSKNIMDVNGRILSPVTQNTNVVGTAKNQGEVIKCKADNIAERLQRRINKDALTHDKMQNYIAELKGTGISADDAVELVKNILVMARHAGSKGEEITTKINWFWATNKTSSIKAFIEAAIIQPNEADSNENNPIWNKRAASIKSVVTGLIHTYVGNVYKEDSFNQYEKSFNSIRAELRNINDFKGDKKYILECMEKYTKKIIQEDKLVFENLESNIHISVKNLITNMTLINLFTNAKDDKVYIQLNRIRHVPKTIIESEIQSITDNNALMQSSEEYLKLYEKDLKQINNPNQFIRSANSENAVMNVRISGGIKDINLSDRDSSNGELRGGVLIKKFTQYMQTYPESNLYEMLISKPEISIKNFKDDIYVNLAVTSFINGLLSASGISEDDLFALEDNKYQELIDQAKVDLYNYLGENQVACEPQSSGSRINSQNNLQERFSLQSVPNESLVRLKDHEEIKEFFKDNSLNVKNISGKYGLGNSTKFVVLKCSGGIYAVNIAEQNKKPMLLWKRDQNKNDYEFIKKGQEAEVSGKTYKAKRILDEMINYNSTELQDINENYLKTLEELYKFEISDYFVIPLVHQNGHQEMRRIIPGMARDDILKESSWSFIKAIKTLNENVGLCVSDIASNPNHTSKQNIMYDVNQHHYVAIDQSEIYANKITNDAENIWQNSSRQWIWIAYNCLPKDFKKLFDDHNYNPETGEFNNSINIPFEILNRLG
jgi:hypothetical protein